MSGKPATPAVSRAGVPGPGAPRLLVYVADPRQIDPGAAPPEPLLAPASTPSASSSSSDTLYISDNLQHHITLPRNTIYRAHPVDQNDSPSLPNTVFYQSLNDNSGKLTHFGTPEKSVIQQSDVCPLTKQQCLKVDENSVNNKRDCANSIAEEIESVLHTRLPVETSDISTYQTQCSGIVDIDNMSSIQPVLFRHGFSENDSIYNSDGRNSNDNELSIDSKKYVNYQFLEQSVSHQSIVNQSISILNQEVGVNRGLVSESECGNVPQILHTPEGVMLAVLPSPALNQCAEVIDQCSRTITSDFPQTITVPLGWRRIISGTSVLYLSPSGTALGNLPQLREYLQTAGTCKCGLPCPLRPEIAFSFDPKVVSKPYQPAAGAELTRLCNHKRKLLATLQARSLSPSTPPPQQNPHPNPHLQPEHKKVGEVAVLKKKMKKRPGYPTNMSVSQMMVQKERPLTEFKPQDNGKNRATSPTVRQSNSINSSTLTSMMPIQQNIPNVMSQEVDIKPETYMQKGSHYLTVNSGWITQHQQNLDTGQKNQNSTSPINSNNQVNVGMPILGNNGQIIGVNTGYNKQVNNFKPFMGMNPQNPVDQEHKNEKRHILSSEQNVSFKQIDKDEDVQMFCGLNQALTPEVMQKINEQQHLFIQQNQKQIELAMKGYRTHLSDNMNQNKTQNQNFLSQAQLVNQNGIVVKTNPAKTPPWQVKRNDSAPILTSPNPKQKSQNVVSEESNAHISEESSGSTSSYHNEYLMNQTMYSRVPPLPQHYNMLGQQWPGTDITKKKVKNNSKSGKKKVSTVEGKVVTYHGGSHGVRIVQDSKERQCNELTNHNVPSFMDDPNGYLAQQTVLLNNTISRQVGVHAKYESNQYENSSEYSLQNQGDKSCKLMGKNSDVTNIFRNNMVSNPTPSPSNIPDSSVINDKSMENPSSQCCKGCTGIKGNSSDIPEHQMRLKSVKHNMYKMELDGNLVVASPRQTLDDSPVTSSTFIDRSLLINDNCDPIQAGTVSTSNVSPIETLQPPEPSPTPSNSSRSTDTPHSSGSYSSQHPSNCPFPLPSPANSNTGSCRDSFNNNPSTTPSSQSYPYNFSGLPSNQLITGTQMMHFISNHNVNKNLMEVDNISMLGVKPSLKAPQDILKLESRRIMDHSMPGYCPPPHLGGGPAHSLIQACYVQTFVTTMASGFSVTRDTVTSVLAGKANTATTSINGSYANFIRPPPPPSVNLATSYAIPNNQPDPFINSVNLPTSYPLHIAGTTAQNMISKSPLEMVQNVIGSLPSKTESSNSHITTVPQNRRPCAPTTPGQILISSTGQIIVSNNQMPPPPPKSTTAISQIQASSNVTNVTTSVAQAIPAVGAVQPIVNPSTVVVNTLAAPFVLQPSMMAVDGQVVHQNPVLPQIVSGGIVPGQSPNDSRNVDLKSSQNFVQGMAMLSPESLKKRNKKKKSQTQNITNVLHITAPQQNAGNIMVHHTSPQQNNSPQFSPRGFQLSPNNNISPAPMLQALTIVPGKSGTPAHIVMNGQGNSNNFGSQQIITNTSPSQQINLLQPVNLINNAGGVMPNFQTFQQFIVPNIGGMMMTADGTALIQDNPSGMQVQLQLQTVNGQNVLTPVQNPGVFSANPNGGVVIRAQNQQGKLIQSQTSPGAQFMSPNSQVMMNSPNFNGQLSPLLANLSPTNVTFNTTPQVRPGNVPTQEFIQTNQIGQTVMVPLSPKQVSLASASVSRNNSTLVQQNTTIVQQQTTLVSNSQNPQISMGANIQGNASRLSIDPNILLVHKQSGQKAKSIISIPQDIHRADEIKEEKHQPGSFETHRGDGFRMENSEKYGKLINELNAGMCEDGGIDMEHVRHSVSTQTLVNQRAVKSPNGQAASGNSCSPPDTTTHSPLGALASLDPSPAPRLYPPRCLSAQSTLADTTTKSPEPLDTNSSAMVQCVSSSEQDMAESRERAWSTPRNDFNVDADRQNVISNIPMMRNRSQNPIEPPDLHYNHNLNASSINNQHGLMSTPNYYDRNPTYKRKNEFGDMSIFRADKMMRTNNYSMIPGFPKESDFDNTGITSPGKSQTRHYQPSGTNSDASVMHKSMERNLGSGNDVKSEDEESTSKEMAANEKPSRKFEVGDLVWGPVKGYASWPGKLEGWCDRGRWSVRWFGGDKALGSVEDARLLTLSEGLEAHHAARTKHRKSRKMNTLLENAIQEAMAELDKKCESGLSKDAAGTSDEAAEIKNIIDIPKRSRKQVKLKHHKKSVLKFTQSRKAFDNTRLRSSR